MQIYFELLCTRTGIERRKGGLRLRKACIQSAPSSLPSTTLCFCYATTRSIGTTPTYVQVRDIKMNSLADTRCKKRPCVMSAVFVFFVRLYLRLTFCLKKKKKKSGWEVMERSRTQRSEGKAERASQWKLCCSEVSRDVTHLHHVAMTTPHQHQLAVGRKSQCLCWYVTVRYPGRKSLYLSRKHKEPWVQISIW